MEFVNGEFTRVRRMTQIRGGVAGRKEFTVTSEALHLLRSREHLAQAAYGGFKSLGEKRTLSPDKTFACDAFCLVLSVSGRTGGKEGAAQACRQPLALAGARSSLIYSPRCLAIAMPGPQKGVI